MQRESSKNFKEKPYLPSLEIEKENIICKDGFCSIPSPNKTSRIGKDDKNLFDPI